MLLRGTGYTRFSGVVSTANGIGLVKTDPDPDTPEEDCVVIWFDGTDIKAKNSDGQTTTLNSSAFA